MKHQTLNNAHSTPNTNWACLDALLNSLRLELVRRDAPRDADATVRCSTFNARRAGLTLAEVAISTLIVGLMMVASLKSVGGVYTTWTSAADKYGGISLADQLLEEIMQSEYEEPDVTIEFGPEVGEGNGIRNAWDDVDDYLSWSKTPPSKKTGAAFPNYDGWTRTATVQLASVTDPTVIPASDEGLKLITVTVTDPNGNTTTRPALRSRWGTLQQASLVDSTWITEVDIQLTTGSGASTTSAASIPNAAEDYGNGNGN